MAKKPVKLKVQDPYVYLENGIVKLTLSKPGGCLVGIEYGGMDNLLDTKLKQTNRGYWAINWNLPGGQGQYKMLEGVRFSVVHSSNESMEISFRSTFDPSSSRTTLPLSVDKRIILRSGISGFHCYAIYERLSGWPDFDLVQTRMVFKLRRDRFHYMAITDKKQRVMPMPEDRLPGRCIELAYPEAVLLTNPINPALKGEVDDKYQYSMDNKDGGVHGWISSGPILGFWVIFPSHEFRNGGPTKLNLTCHTGPTCLAGYQFWVQTDSNGSFTINNVCPGVYSVYGWVLGFIGDYLAEAPISIIAGSQTTLGNLTYVPPRDGPTLWEIGFPDRTSLGFYVPDPNPLYVNKLFVNSSEKFRQYGLWDRYTDLYPETDLVFMVGVNDSKKDWFFAQVDRRSADKTFHPSTWKIKFNLSAVTSGVYKLRLSLASATHSDLQVRMNDPDASHPLFQVSDLGTDNTTARHGIHGLYHLFSVDVHSSLLVVGDNTIFLTQARGGDEFFGIFYDYMRLEGPQTS